MTEPQAWPDVDRRSGDEDHDRVVVLEERYSTLLRGQDRVFKQLDTILEKIDDQCNACPPAHAIAGIEDDIKGIDKRLRDKNVRIARVETQIKDRDKQAGIVGGLVATFISILLGALGFLLGD